MGVSGDDIYFYVQVGLITVSLQFMKATRHDLPTCLADHKTCSSSEKGEINLNLF